MDQTEAIECPICLTEVKQYAQLLKCEHHGCAECMIRALTINKLCPLCRESCDPSGELFVLPSVKVAKAAEKEFEYAPQSSKLISEPGLVFVLDLELERETKNLLKYEKIKLRSEDAVIDCEVSLSSTLYRLRWRILEQMFCRPIVSVRLMLMHESTHIELGCDDDGRTLVDLGVRAGTDLLVVGVASVPIPKLARSAAVEFEVKVKLLDSSEQTIRVDDVTTIASMTEAIAEYVGLRKERIRLILRGQPLLLDKTVKECRIRNGDMIHAL